MSTHHCEICKADTNYEEQLVRKPSSYDNKKSLPGRFMLFIHEFINGGHYYNMNRYLKCKTCGNKVLSNQGNEFE